MDKSWSLPMIGDRVIGSNTCDLEGSCRSSGPCRKSRRFNKFSRKRACCSSARSAEGESGGRHSAIASPVCLNWSRAVNWSSSSHGVELRVLRISFFHSVVAIAVPVLGVSGPSRQAERQLPSHACCYKRCEVSLPCVTQVLNCTRVCTSDRKDETGLDFGGAGLRLLDIPRFDFLFFWREASLRQFPCQSLKRRGPQPNLVRSRSTFSQW